MVVAFLFCASCVRSAFVSTMAHLVERFHEVFGSDKLNDWHFGGEASCGISQVTIGRQSI